MYSRLLLLGIVIFCLVNGSTVNASSGDSVIDLDTLIPDETIAVNKNWGVNADLGAGLARGNTDYLTVDANLLTFKKIYATTVYLIGDTTYRETSGQKNANSAWLTGKFDFHMYGRWSWVFLNTIGHNEFTKINLKDIIATGPLYNIKYKNITDGISLLVSHNYEKHTDGSMKNEPRLTLRNEFSLTLNKTTTFFLDFYYNPVADNFKDYILWLKPKIQSKIWADWLSFFVAANIVHDSMPVSGVQRNDIQITTGLAFSIDG